MKSVLRLTAILLVAVFATTSCKKEYTEPDYGLSGFDFHLTTAIAQRTLNESMAIQSGYKNQSEFYKLDTASISSSMNADDSSLTITYNNTTDEYCLRNGSVTVSKNEVARSSSATTCRITFNNLQLTYLPSGNAYTLNGHIDVNNLDGGSFADLLNGTRSRYIQYNITTDNMQIQPKGEANLQWTFDFAEVVQMKEDVLRLSLVGETLDGTDAKVICTGTDRYGQSFECTLSEKIASSRYCGISKASLGHITLKAGSRNTDIKHSVDNNGAPVGGDGCPYGTKITYTRDSETKTIIVPYL